MTIKHIERSFRERVCAELSIQKEGKKQYRVHTPFVHNDGDFLSIVLRETSSGWELSDEATTYMHLGYSLDDRALDSGTRQKVIADTLAFFGIEDDDGELRLPISDSAFGEALYGLVQAMLRISDVTFLSRERAASAFKEDLKGRPSPGWV